MQAARERLCGPLHGPQEVVASGIYGGTAVATTTAAAAATTTAAAATLNFFGRFLECCRHLPSLRCDSINTIADKRVTIEYVGNTFCAQLIDKRVADRSDVSPALSLAGYQRPLSEEGAVGELSERPAAQAANAGQRTQNTVSRACVGYDETWARCCEI